jgi:Deacetylase PdaC
MMRAALLLLPALALTACDVLGSGNSGSGGKEPPPAVATPVPEPTDTTPEAVKISEDTELYSFDFAYPAEVAAIPELKQRLDREMATAREKLLRQAKEAQADAREQGFPYNAYAEGRNWQVVANTPRFLSLSASVYSYTGGAHPNGGTTALVWDREAKRALAPMDFFTSPEALEEAVRDPYCTALDKERGQRRGPEGDNIAGEFGDCPPIKDLTVLLGSSGGKTFNRLGLVADPYVAGPYAEGDYDITVPVTAKVLAAVRPAYRDAFSLR